MYRLIPYIFPAFLLSPLSAAAAESEDVFENLAQDLQEGGSSTQHPSEESEPAPAVTTPSAMNPEIGVVLDVGAAWFSDEDPLQSGAHDPTENGFNLQQLELSLRAPVDPYLRLDAFIVLGPEEVELEEAYGTTLDLPAGLQVRFGKFLTRFGRMNATHPHSWDFADQPFALGRVFGGEASRGLGTELSLLLPLPWYVELVASATTATGAESNRSFLGDATRRVEGPEDLLFVTSVKQFHSLSDAWALLWGLSGAFGPNDNGPEGRSAIYGGDLFLKYRPLGPGATTQLRAQSEVFVRQRAVPRDVITDVSMYSQLALRFAQRWESALRYEYGSTPFSTEGRPVLDPQDPDWTDERHRVTASLTHLPTEFSRFRLQGGWDRPQFRPDPIYSVMLTAELVAGAHGAHTY
ncbi:MAG: hypothetical protein R3B13_39595 [Polyangiaceae bacterium]